MKTRENVIKSLTKIIAESEKYTAKFRASFEKNGFGGAYGTFSEAERAETTLEMAKLILKQVKENAESEVSWESFHAARSKWFVEQVMNQTRYREAEEARQIAYKTMWLVLNDYIY